MQCQAGMPDGRAGYMPGWQGGICGQAGKVIIERIRFAGSSVADQPLRLTDGYLAAAVCLTSGALPAALRRTDDPLLAAGHQTG